jgi:hypothetical protein
MLGSMTEDLAQRRAEEVVVAREVRELAPAPPASLAPVQAAAVAAGSFLAGATAMAVVKRRATRRARRRARRPGDVLPIVASRSFLVDVHVLGRE